MSLKKLKIYEMTKIVSAFFIVCLFISCTNKVYNSSSWQSKQITVDGKIPEWSNPLRFYDQETGISYCISNDHYNLYLVCSISNEFMQTKILRSGLEFGIDTLGKKSFSVGVRYPIGNISEKELKTNTNPPTSSASNGKPDRSAFKLKLLAEATEIQLVGFKPQLGKFISLVDSNKSGISAAINFDMNGIMNYEAVIPFSTFYKKELTPSDSNRVFNYQIKINPVAKSNNGSNSGGGSRGGGSRGGGMGGGGMRGGGMGGGGMRGGGMRGGGMNGGGMNGGNRMSGENGANGYQRNANISGVTKTKIKLKLAYR
jgi:hypothetical protein